MVVEFCIICFCIEATLVGTLRCNVTWPCRNEENVEGLSSGCAHQCVMF